MATNIGINVLEVDGTASPTVAAAPVSVAGFLVRSERGVPNLAVPLRGISDLSSNFGGFIDNGFGAHVVRGFFDNGGTKAYAARIVGAGATAAQQTLDDRAAAPTLSVSAGRRGRLDPGVWGNQLQVSVTDHPRANAQLPAQIAGASAEPFALVDGATLDVTVNGAAAAVTITFNSADFANIGAASAAEVAAVIRRQTTALRAAVLPDQRLLLASANPGPESRLEVAAGPMATALGFTGAASDSAGGVPAASTSLAVQSTGGILPGSAVRLQTRGHVVAQNPVAAGIVANSGITVTPDGGAPVGITFTDADFVGGVGAITPGEVVAAINNRAQGFVAALNDDNRVVLLSNSFGPGSSIAIGPGAPDATAGLGLDVIDTVAGAEVRRGVDSVSEQGRLITWTGGLAAALRVNGARLQTAEFDLIVSRQGTEIERFESLSMQDTLDYYVEAVVNDELSGSRFVTVSDLNSASGPAQDVPAVVTLAAMTPGSDGAAPTDLDYVGNPAQRTGLHAFDSVQIQLLSCPETTSSGVVSAALAYCESRGDAMFVGAAPRGYGLDEIETYAAGLRARKVFGALYAPWIQILNPADASGNNPLLWVPPVGHVLGAYARIADTRGVWKAPAGDEALLRNALGVEFDMTDAEHTNLVKNGGVNGIRAIPGSGIVIDASRTLSSDTRWLFVNVRRLFNFVKSSLRDGLRFVAQEPNSEDLRRSVKFNVVTPFLLGLWRQGAFGSDPAEDVFTIICDESNNPPAEVNQGNFRIEVYFYPVKPAETVLIVVGQQESGATASEA